MPTRRIAADLDLLTFSLLNARMSPVASDPGGLGTGDSGRLIFNTTAGKFKIWSGTAWVDPLARAGHTGTQLASTISDFTTAVQALQWSSMAVPTSPVPMGSQRLTSVADPTSAQDAATRAYVDNALAGLTSGQIVKGAVRVAASSNISLTTPGATIDGVTMTSGDIVLLTGQTTGSQNGPYVWTGASSALTRATNWDTSGEAVLGSYWVVEQGTNADQFALLTNDTPLTLGTTTPTFVFRGSAGATYTAGAGLFLTGTDFNIGAGTGISVAADAIAVDTTVVGRKVTGSIPAATGGIFSISGSNVTVNHQLANSAPDVSVTYGSGGPTPGAPVDLDWNATDANNVLLTLPAAPVANYWVVSVIG